MHLVRLRGKRQVTVPADLAREAGLKEGDWLEIVRAGETLVLRPKQVLDRARSRRSLLDAVGTARGAFETPEAVDRFIREGRQD